MKEGGENKEREREGGEEKRKEGCGRKAEKGKECDLERSGRGSFMEEIMRKALSRIARLREVEERKGEAKRRVIITELEEIADKEEILERGVMIKRYWGVGVDENLLIGERRMRWRMVEAVRKKGDDDKQLWVEGRK